jgi:hypothetical protein
VRVPGQCRNGQARAEAARPGLNCTSSRPLRMQPEDSSRARRAGRAVRQSPVAAAWVRQPRRTLVQALLRSSRRPLRPTMTVEPSCQEPRTPGPYGQLRCSVAGHRPPRQPRRYALPSSSPSRVLPGVAKNHAPKWPTSVLGHTSARDPARARPLTSASARQRPARPRSPRNAISLSCPCGCCACCRPGSLERRLRPPPSPVGVSSSAPGGHFTFMVPQVLQFGSPPTERCATWVPR